jgi:hypothetical protein
LIHFYAGGGTASGPIPGSIKYIFKTQGGPFAFAVQRQLPISDGTIDPFEHYPHFPAKLYASQLGDTLEIVKVDWVMSHFVRWDMSRDHAIVLSLSRVRVLFSIALLMLTFITGLKYIDKPQNGITCARSSKILHDVDVEC